MEAPMAGDNRYNNLLSNSLNQKYNNKTKAFLTKYKNELVKFDDSDLSENDKLSKAILAWECDNNLEGLTFREDLIPLNQFTGLHLTVGQFASSSSAQPFKTVADYNNWLQRLIAFNDWVISAEAKMKEGILKGYVLPKSLTEKLIPQLKDLEKVEIILSEMEKAKTEVSFKGDLKSFFNYVRDKKELMPFTEPQLLLISMRFTIK